MQPRSVQADQEDFLVWEVIGGRLGFKAANVVVELGEEEFGFGGKGC